MTCAVSVKVSVVNRACNALNRDIQYYVDSVYTQKIMKVKKAFNLDFDKKDHGKWCKEYFNYNHYSLYSNIAESNPDESNIRSDST